MARKFWSSLLAILARQQMLNAHWRRFARSASRSSM
jgi:hypothetical protein